MHLKIFHFPSDRHLCKYFSQIRLYFVKKKMAFLLHLHSQQNKVFLNPMKYMLPFSNIPCAPYTALDVNYRKMVVFIYLEALKMS